jgi:hypothetical protein
MGRRLINHEKYYEKLLGLSSERHSTLFVMLKDFFTERIFMHNKTKLFQYLPLFFFANADKLLVKASTPLPKSAIDECKFFAQLMMSRLISLALPLKGEDPTYLS